MKVIQNFLSARNKQIESNQLLEARQKNLELAQTREQRAAEAHKQQMQLGDVRLGTAQMGQDQLAMQLEAMQNKLDDYYVKEFDEALEVAHETGDLKLMKTLIRKDKTSELFGDITDVQKFENSPDAEDLYDQILDGVDTDGLTHEAKVKLARKLAPDAIVLTKPNGEKELASVSELMKAFGYTNRQSKEKSERFTKAASAGSLKALHALAVHYGDEEGAKGYLSAMKELGATKGGGERRMHSFNYLDGIAMGEQEAKNKGLVPGTEEFTAFTQQYAAEYIDYATGTAKTKDSHRMARAVTGNSYMEDIAKAKGMPAYTQRAKDALNLQRVIKSHPDMKLEDMLKGLGTTDKSLKTETTLANLVKEGYSPTAKVSQIPSADLVMAVVNENPDVFISSSSDREQFLANAPAVLTAYKTVPAFAEAVNLQRKNIKADDKSAYETLNRVAPQLSAINTFNRVLDQISKSKVKKNFLTGVSDWINSYTPTITDSALADELAKGLTKKADEYSTRIGLKSAQGAAVAAILKATSGLTVSDKERQMIYDMTGDFDSMADVKKFIHASQGYNEQMNKQLQDEMKMIEQTYPELAAHTLASYELARAKRTKEVSKTNKKVKEKKSVADQIKEAINGL